MAIGSAPLDSIDIDTVKKSRAADDLKHTHGCVWPDGRVTHHVCKPPKKGDVGQRRGDVPLLWMNGEVVVRHRHRKLGCRSLLEVCIADLGAEAGKRKNDRWREAIGLHGKVEVKSPADLYPPTVHKLRREHATGVAEDMVFDPDLGLVPATEDMKAARTKQLLEAADLPVPTAHDRAEAKKAKA